MSNFEIIDELKTGVNELKVEMQEHTELMFQQLNSLSIETTQRNNILDQKNIQKNQLLEDLKSVNSKVEIAKDEIKRTTHELANQQNKIEELRSIKNKFQSTKKENSAKLEDLLKDNIIREVSLDQLSEEIAKFENHFLNIKNSTEDNIIEYLVKVEKARTDLKSLDTEFGVWAFLMEKVRNPEIEIMAFLSGKESISIEEIKRGIKTVQSVFISRALSKLQTDGKVIQDNSGKWEISPQFLVLINR